MRPPLLAALCFLLPSLALAGDARCKGSPQARAARFSEQHLKGRQPAERYAEYVRACSLDAVVELTKSLVRFKTVSSELPAAKSPEIAAMGRFLEQWAREQGLGFRTVGDHDVFELSWGEGEPRLGLVFHGDVVPAPAHEWKKPPFEPYVAKGRLYGRGVEDDKGPLASTLVALAMAKELGLSAAQGKVLVIIGNGEESDWSGMVRYAETQKPHPTHVISVDSNFPVVAAQGGFVAWALEAALGPPPAHPTPGQLRAVDVTAGEFLTQVPGAATLKLEPAGLAPDKALAAVREAVAAVRTARPSLQAEVKQEGPRLVLTTHGRAVHASVAEEGANALWDLAAVAAKLPLEANGIEAMLRVVAERFDGDHWGEKLGVAYQDALMGRLLVAPTVLRVKDGKVGLEVNMRRPQGKDSAAFHASLDEAAARLERDTGGRVKELKEGKGGEGGRYVGDPHVADTSGPLVTTLLDIYQRHRKAPDAKPQSVRGGTYARLFPRAVDFGPAFLGDLYTGHAPDESISLDNLDATTRMVAEALHTLALTPPAK